MNVATGSQMKFLFPQIVMAAMLCASCAHSADKVALVIGEANYQGMGTLSQARTDTDAVVATLEQLDFEVTEVIDATRQGVTDALAGFAERAAASQTAVLYFSGYGISMRKENYLLPVDARSSSDFQIHLEAIALKDAVSALAGAKTKLVMVNTASNNPFLEAVKYATVNTDATNTFTSVEGAGLSLFVSQAELLTSESGEPSSYAKNFIEAVGQADADLASALVSMTAKLESDGSGKAVHFGSVQPDVRLSQQPTQMLPGASNSGVVVPDETSIEKCDRLATDPNDSLKSGQYVGVENDTDLSDAARTACEAAVKLHPDNPRLLYQAGRAARDDAQRRRYFEKAAGQGSIQARAAIARQVLSGLAGFEKDEIKASQMLDDLISQGATSAMVMRASIHIYGEARKRNIFEAARLLHLAYERDNATAAATLADIYLNGIGTEKNPTEAMNWYQRAANKGTGVGFDQLGDIFRNGVGTQKNPAIALKMYLTAAKFSESESRAAIIAEMYDTGSGTPRNPSEATNWYLKAGAVGEYQIARRLDYGTGIPLSSYDGDMVTANANSSALADAFIWYKRAAEHGYARAQWHLGYLYYLGYATDENLSLALEWFRKAGHSGYMPAQRAVGTMYLNGYGVPKDYLIAREWYIKAAEKGDEISVRLLGEIGESSSPPNYREAEHWYKKGAEAGDSLAMSDLGLLYARGLGSAPNHVESFKWYRKAAEAGHGESMNRVGVNYSFGKGVSKSYVEAGKWYEKAAAAGFEYANLNLAILFSRGNGCRKNVALAVQLAELAVRADEEARNDLKSGWSNWTPEFLQAFQRRLFDLGLYKGAIDGRFGSGTLAAIDALAAS
jgi:TPR repeat protein